MTSKLQSIVKWQTEIPLGTVDQRISDSPTSKGGLLIKRQRSPISLRCFETQSLRLLLTWGEPFTIIEILIILRSVQENAATVEPFRVYTLYAK